MKNNEERQASSRPDPQSPAAARRRRRCAAPQKLAAAAPLPPGAAPQKINNINIYFKNIIAGLLFFTCKNIFKDPKLGSSLPGRTSTFRPFAVPVF